MRTAGKFVNVPIDRIAAKVDFVGGFYHEYGFQGPGGCYVVQETDADPDGGKRVSVFQVWHVDRAAREMYRVSEPFLTSAGARQFAARLAAGGSTAERFA